MPTIALVLAAAAPALSAQEIILLRGRVLDTAGRPVNGAVIELWQADRNGNYDHPADAPAAELLDDFQYYGTSTADADGRYAFRTEKPARYGGRPPHLHFKVKLGGEEVLTSQFYFPEDRAAVAGDPVFGRAGDSVFLKPGGAAELGSAGGRALIGDIVLDLNGAGGGRLAPTARQTEGPYYPELDFSGYDNDLTRPTTDDPPAATAGG